MKSFPRDGIKKKQSLDAIMLVTILFIGAMLLALGFAEFELSLIGK